MSDLDNEPTFHTTQHIFRSSPDFRAPSRLPWYAWQSLKQNLNIAHLEALLEELLRLGLCHVRPMPLPE